MKSKGAFFILAILAFFFSFFCKFISPLYSQPDPDYSELSALKPFSENSNYMSIEGYIALRHKINTGETLNRSQARRIYKRFVKLAEKKSCVNKRLQAAGIKTSKKILDELTDRLNSIRSQNIQHRKENTFTKVLFLNISKNPKDIKTFDYINHYTKKRFESNKNLILKFDDKILTEYILCKTYLNSIARNNKADIIVCNSLIECKKNKKINIPASYIDFWLFGLEKRFKISISTLVYDARNDEIKFENYAESSKKHQIFGLFHGYRGVMSYAVKQAVEELYNGCELLENL